jgi:hypothetical protein
VFFIRSKAISLLLRGLICFIPIKGILLATMVTEHDASFVPYIYEKPSPPDEIKGYRNITAYEDQFLAVGTNGRIDRINKFGKITPVINPFNIKLNGVIYYNQTIIAVGNGGTILVSKDGQKCTKIESSTTKNINSITSFIGILIAAADHGTILISENENNWRKIQLPLKGDIVSISAETSICYGVTNKGEIIKTNDAINWDIIDYNSKYAGYNKPCSFKNVLIAGKRIAVIGQHEDNSPVVLFSSLGNVWMERSLNYTNDQGIIHFVTNLPNNICYDAIENQFFLACDNGEVLSLPSCDKCNKSYIITEKNLQGIICSENILMIVGDDYYVNAIDIAPTH